MLLNYMCNLQQTPPSGDISIFQVGGFLKLSLLDLIFSAMLIFFHNMNKTVILMMSSSKPLKFDQSFIPEIEEEEEESSQMLESNT